MTRYRMTAFFGGVVLLVLSGCQRGTSGPTPSTSPGDVSVAPTTTTTKAVDKGIDAATVAAYEKEGARYGGWVKHERDGPGVAFGPSTRRFDAKTHFFDDVTFFSPPPASGISLPQRCRPVTVATGAAGAPARSNGTTEPAVIGRPAP